MDYIMYGIRNLSFAKLLNIVLKSWNWINTRDFRFKLWRNQNFSVNWVTLVKVW